MNKPNDRIGLNDTKSIPCLGLGVFRAEDGDQVYVSVRRALDLGYRLIDTAALYKNEAGVGKAIRESGIPREEIFLVTKLWNNNHGTERAIAACEESLKKLGMEYIDLYLIHWPGMDTNLRLKTWDALLKLREQKKILSAGVSNFTPDDLDTIISGSGVVPAVNQIELNPWLTQKPLLAYMRQKGIIPMAWAPLHRMRMGEEPVIADIAEKYGKTGAQVILRWHMQTGAVPIPKSTNPGRILENAQIFDFELTPEEMKNLDALNRDASIVDAVKQNTMDFI